MLLHRNPLFEEDYKTYRASIDREETDLQNYINNMFTDPNVKLQDLISVMTQLGEILNRPNMKEHLLEKYQQLLERYREYLQNILEFFHQNCNCPPIPNGFTSIGGSIAWAKILGYNATRFWQFFNKVYIQIQDEDQNAMLADGSAADTLDETVKFFPPNGYTTILREYSKKINIMGLYDTLMKELK